MHFDGKLILKIALVITVIIFVIFMAGRSSAETAPKGTIIFNPPLTQPAPEPRKWVPWCERFRNPHITSPNRCGEPEKPHRRKPCIELIEGPGGHLIWVTCGVTREELEAQG